MTDNHSIDTVADSRHIKVLLFMGEAACDARTSVHKRSCDTCNMDIDMGEHNGKQATTGDRLETEPYWVYV